MNMDVNQRQLLISKSDDLFDILRDEQVTLSTAELIEFKINLDISPLYKLPLLNMFKFESCLFTKNGSEVIARYNTWEKAVKGHQFLSEKYGLTIHEEYVIP